MPDTQPHMQAALGEADYQQLYTMAMSSDDSARTQAATIAKKLTPGERQDFFDYQQRVHEAQPHTARVDNSVLGMPPELAVTGALGIGRAVAAEGLTLAQRGIAGAKALGSQVAPALKYELTKSALEKIGAPPAVAVTVALAVSGYKKGGAATAESASADAAAADAGPAASRPAAPVPQAGPSAPPASPTPIEAPPPAEAPARVQAKAVRARAMKTAAAPTVAPPVTLTAEEQKAVDTLQAQGYSKEQVDQALAQIGKQRAPAPAPSAAPPQSAPAKVSLSAAESKELMRLMKAGKSPADAMSLVQAQRNLAQRLGLPTPAEVRQGVVERNATGRWPE